MFMPGVWILWSKKNVIIFQKENGNTFTLLIIFIEKSLQKEQNSTNPPICRNKPAITPKWFNSLDTNSRCFPICFFPFEATIRYWWFLLIGFVAFGISLNVASQSPVLRTILFFFLNFDARSLVHLKFLYPSLKSGF